VIRKLSSLSYLLSHYGLRDESEFAGKLALAESSRIKEVLEALKGVGPNLGMEPEGEKEEQDPDKLRAWEELLKAIEGNEKFPYEIDMKEISRRLSKDTEAARAKGNIPKKSDDEREEILPLLSGNLSELIGQAKNSADDQMTEDLPIITSDFDKLQADTDKAISSIIGLPEGQANLNKGIFKRAFLQVAGALASLTLFTKNVNETYNNGLNILSNLPLSDYGLSVSDAIKPGGAIDALDNQVDVNSDDPKKLMEILEISSVIKAFQLDLVFSITNGIALILDTISLALLAAPEPVLTKIAAVIFGIGDFLFQIFGLLGIELASEHLSEKHWSPIKEKIHSLAKEAVGQG